MVTEKELMDAIRQCEREPVTQSKISRLADFYIVYDHLFGEDFNAAYSYTQPISDLQVNGESDFLKTINGKNSDKVFQKINELVETIRVLHPRIYDSFMSKLNNI